MRAMEILTERLCLKEYGKSCINDYKQWGIYAFISKT